MADFDEREHWRATSPLNDIVYKAKSPWQPIETVPINGPTVLVWVPDSDAEIEEELEAGWEMKDCGQMFLAETSRDHPADGAAEGRVLWWLPCSDELHEFEREPTFWMRRPMTPFG